MNDLDDRLRGAFAARAERTTVDYRTDIGASVAAPVPSRSWRPIMAIAAATVAVAVGGLALIARSPADDEVPATVPPPVSTTAISTAPPADLGTNPLLPEVFPALPSDDPRNATAAAAYSGFVSFGTTQAGRAVNVGRAIIGRLDSGELLDPMSVSVYADADDIAFATTGDQVVIDGIGYERHRVGTSPVQRTLVLRGATDAVITGADPEAFVAAAQGIPVTDATLTPDGGVTFSLTPLPDGYDVIVEPVTFPSPSPVVDLMFGSEADDSFGRVATGRLSDLLLHVTGTSFRQVDVNGIPGWASQPPAGTVGLVIWKVAPDTWATSIGPTPTAALDVARSVTFVDEATWQATYDVARPDDTGFDAPAPPSATSPAGSPPPSSMAT